MVLLAILLVVPLCLYFGQGGGRGEIWGLLPAGEEVRGDGAYRQARVRAWRHGRAPLVVRAAALSSFFLGQMIVPGLLAAVAGVLMLFWWSAPLVWVLVLSAPTGLVVAAHLLSAGSAMLGRADDAPSRARRAARWALGHNLALLVGLGLATVIDPNDDAGIALLPATYACVSLAQALLVRRAARALEAYAALQGADPAPLRALEGDGASTPRPS